MKRKLLGLLCGGVMAFSLFVAFGNNVEAAKPNDDDCGCPVDLVKGMERNKNVAAVISSDLFKNTKFKLKELGYKWDGASSIQVGYPHIPEGVEVPEGYRVPLVVLVPFFNNDGSVKIAYFSDGLVVVRDLGETHEH